MVDSYDFVSFWGNQTAYFQRLFLACELFVSGSQYQTRRGQFRVFFLKMVGYTPHFHTPKTLIIFFKIGKTPWVCWGVIKPTILGVGVANPPTHDSSKRSDFSCVFLIRLKEPSALAFSDSAVRTVYRFRIPATGGGGKRIPGFIVFWGKKHFPRKKTWGKF